MTSSSFNRLRKRTSLIHSTKRSSRQRNRRRVEYRNPMIRLESGVEGDFSWAMSPGALSLTRDRFLDAGEVTGVFDGLGLKKNPWEYAEKAAQLVGRVTVRELLGENRGDHLREFIDRGWAENWDDALVYRLHTLFEALDQNLSRRVEFPGGGTTALSAFRLRDPNDCPLTALVNIGDSRGYLHFGSGKTHLLTRDQTPVQREIDRGPAWMNNLLPFPHPKGHQTHIFGTSFGFIENFPDIVLLRPKGQELIEAKGYFHRVNFPTRRGGRRVYWGGQYSNLRGRLKLGPPRGESSGEFPRHPILMVKRTYRGSNPRLLLTTDGFFEELGYWWQEQFRVYMQEHNLFPKTDLDRSQVNYQIEFPIAGVNPYIADRLVETVLRWVKKNDLKFVLHHGLAASLLSNVYGRGAKKMDDSALVSHPLFF